MTLAPDIHEQIASALHLLARCKSDDAVVRAEALYAHWYAAPRQPLTAAFACPPDLTEMLRAAHPGFTHWEDKWRVESVGPRGQAVVRRGPAIRLLDRSDYAPLLRRGLLPRPGDEVSATSRRDRVEGDGWYRTSGRSWSWTAPGDGLVRLYIQRGLAEVPPLVAAFTHLLALEPEPWLLKCATDPAQYARNDAIVAYVTRGIAERWASQLCELAVAGGTLVRGGGPPLTFPVAPGMAAAFDPSGNESFGAHRCRLIAEASVGTVQAVLERFIAEGVDPVRPWACADDPLLPWER